MTREERMAAGWVECWGLFDVADNTWWTGQAGWLRTPAHRRAMTRTDAKRDAVESNDSAIPRRFWRRKKPKAPPPLAVGDEVVVRGKVAKLRLDDPLEPEVALTFGDDSTVRWFDHAYVERVKP